MRGSIPCLGCRAQLVAWEAENKSLATGNGLEFQVKIPGQLCHGLRIAAVCFSYVEEGMGFWRGNRFAFLGMFKQQ